MIIARLVLVGSVNILKNRHWHRDFNISYAAIEILDFVLLRFSAFGRTNLPTHRSVNHLFIFELPSV